MILRLLREYRAAARQRRHYRVVRRRCQQRLAAEGIPLGIDVETLRAELERRRGRPIRLVPLALAREDPSITGAWWMGTREDYLCFELETGLIHQCQIIFHELSHMICRHSPKKVSEDLMNAVRAAVASALQRELNHLDLGRLNPEIMGGTVRLRAGLDSDPHEVEAEEMARLLGEEARRRIPEPRTLIDPQSSAVLERLERALNGRRGQAG